ncbi:MAG TPA: 2,3-bisphosphoglycerate-independent phosphoglycerate mutase [Planctomycetes bacterium]|nr:2,3-bisphosphoglycerate-independent phosphoglycerate mutase [Planctomycetota bacterium]
MNSPAPTLLIVLDGWGHAPASDSNAITHAPADNFLSWWEKYPHTLLSASGKEVGLPAGLMGNSEVGHTSIGAGRIVRQTISRINTDIDDGGFEQNGMLRNAIEHARVNDSTLHLFGLLGNGGVHAASNHYAALLALAKSMGLRSEQVKIHALLDGRDTAPRSADNFISQLEEMCRIHGGSIASICGRYFGMDRDTNYERTQLFWDVMVNAQSPFTATDASSALQDAYARDENDEFVQPTLIGNGATVNDHDSVISFNFRADRVRQISDAFLNGVDFTQLTRVRRPCVKYTTMTQYRESFDCAVAYPPLEINATFGEVIADAGLRQFRCAETEKYAHVSFFFNGGREDEFAGEDRHLVPSPKVATYDLKPEMSAYEVTAAVLNKLDSGEHALYVVNFANSDMVGHTGLIPAAEAAVRAVDACLKQIVDKALELGGTIAITADHGNAEQMRDPVTGDVHTAHTINPVPLLLISDEFSGVEMRNGVLADVAPTLLKTMGLAQPEVMDGQSLF